jgi:hypothetical protein
LICFGKIEHARSTRISACPHETRSYEVFLPGKALAGSVFGRIRSFAILRNHTQNVVSTRYRIAIGDITVLRSIKFM